MALLNIKKINTMNILFKKHIRFCLVIMFVFLTIFLNAKDKPFGMVKVDTDVYFDETEINVGTWLSYYTWVLIHGGFEAAQKVLPDSNAVEPELWAYIKRKSTDYLDEQGSYTLQPIGYFGKECKECSKFGKRLFSERRYCAMLNFPITGVTYEQVKRFCEWRTKVEGNNKFVFRLPTPKEWTDFALKGLSETERKNGFRDSLNNKKCPYYNFNIKCNCEQDNYQGQLNGVGMYSPEKTGAFDVFGNVSEMTSIKGVAKGGSFKLYANQCHPDSIQHYDKPEIWLGFRSIAVKGSPSDGRHLR
jgi:formylglycine-generating enzyme required for sulfatase activity